MTELVRERIVGRYLFILGALLFIQGAASVIRQAIGFDGGWLFNGLLNADPLHAAIHIAWGSVMMAGAFLFDSRQLASLALVFGIFYVALAVLGVAVYHPLGLRLDIYENAFHWTVGPLTLAVGLGAMR